METIFLSLTKSDFQDIIAETVNACLRKSVPQKIQHDADRWFGINELSEYIPDKPARATIYTWVQNSHIPYHKGKKKLRFLKSEIDQWLKSGRRQTVSEMAMDADNFLSAHK